MRLVAILGSVGVLSTCVVTSCDSDEVQQSSSKLLGSRPAAGGRADAGSLVREVVVDGGAPPYLSCGGLLGPSTCDPITGWPCDVAGGETCDYINALGYFDCLQVNGGVGFCEVCDNVDISCAAGMSCYFGPGLDKCYRYCCADEDCGQGTCFRDLFGVESLAALGYCREESETSCWPAEPAEDGIDAGPSGDASADP